MSPRIQQSEETPDDSEQSNVIAFAPRPRKSGIPAAEPLFADAERAELRAMLREFQLIKQSCPMARRLLQEE